MKIPTEKLRKYAIFGIIPLHVILLILFLETGVDIWIYYALTLLIFLITAELMFWQTHTLTGKYKKVRDFSAAYMPLLIQTVLLIAAEFCFYLVHEDHGGILSDSMKYGVWWLFCVVSTVCALIVTFVIGAARTMLFHDEKGE